MPWFNPGLSHVLFVFMHASSRFSNFLTPSQSGRWIILSSSMSCLFRSEQSVREFLCNHVGALASLKVNKCVGTAMTMSRLDPVVIEVRTVLQQNSKRYTMKVSIII